MGQTVASICRDIEANKIPHLSLELPDYTDDDAFKIAETLKKSPGIFTVSITRKNLTSKGIMAILEAVKGSDKFQHISIREWDIQKEESEFLSDFLAQTPNMKRVSLMGCYVGDDAIGKIMKGLENNITLEEVHLSNNEIGDAGMQAIAQWLKRPRQLTRLSLSANAFSPEAMLDLEAAIHQGGQKNLSQVNGLSGNLSDLADENRNRAYNLGATAKREAAKLKVGSLHKIYERRSAILDAMDDFAAVENVMRFISTLPTINNKKLTPELLVTRDITGYALLDNPKIWPDFEEACQQLAEKSMPLTREHLSQTNRDGMSYLEHAFRYGPTGQVVAGLNVSGIKLRAGDLVAEGKPSVILEAAIARGQVACLFAGDNWRGASKNDLQAVLDVIPEKEKNKISNIHSLKATLSRQSAAVFER